MLKVKLTENYTGVTICGDYDDLDFLYDSINHLIHGDSANINEYMIQNHLYCFLYDLRHAYQGQREAILVRNNLDDYTRENFNFKKKDITDKNVYFCFNYLLTDLLLDMVLIKYFIRKIDKKENDIYNPYVNMVNYFYSLVLQSLEDILTEVKFNEIKNGLLKSIVTDDTYIPQWFEIISIDYINMTKSKREKEFMHIADSIYNYIDYDEYYVMKKRIEKICNEKNCNLSQLHYNYPEKIKW